LCGRSIRSSRHIRRLELDTGPAAQIPGRKRGHRIVSLYEVGYDDRGRIDHEIRILFNRASLAGGRKPDGDSSGAHETGGVYFRTGRGGPSGLRKELWTMPHALVARPEGRGGRGSSPGIAPRTVSEIHRAAHAGACPGRERI